MTNPTPMAAGVAFLVHALLSSVMTRYGTSGSLGLWGTQHRAGCALHVIVLAQEDGRRLNAQDRDETLKGQRPIRQQSPMYDGMRACLDIAQDATMAGHGTRRRWQTHEAL